MADTNDTQAILGERFKKLPKKLQDAITSADLREKLQTVADKYKLHIDQAATLENEVALVMMGVEQTDALRDNLVRQANISREQAEAIVKDINTDIFLPIRDVLKSVASESTSADAPREAPAAQPGATTTASEPVALEESEEKTAQSEETTVAPETATPQELPTSEPNPQPEASVPTQISEQPAQEPQQPVVAAPTPSTEQSTATQAPTNLSTGNIAAQKLGGATQNAAQQEGVTRVDNAQQNGSAQQKPRTYEDDPYREPIEPTDTSLPENR